MTPPSHTPASEPPDRLYLRRHKREVDIGVFAREHGQTQRLRFDVWAELARRPETADDDVDRILSYEHLVEAIDLSIGAGRVALLETLAERIAAAVLAAPAVARVGVRIDKLDRVPGALGIEIVRQRAARLESAEAVARPLVVFLSSGAAASSLLPRWLDGLAQESAVLCPEPDGLPAPTGDAATDRRLALIAQGAAAWRLAARDVRLTVADTRTELLSAAQHGRAVVWAPERLVARAGAAGPLGEPPVALAEWLARELGSELLVVGAEAPPGARAVPEDAEVLR